MLLQTQILFWTLAVIGAIAAVGIVYYSAEMVLAALRRKSAPLPDQHSISGEKR